MAKDIIFYADFDCTTGFGNVAKEIITSFARSGNYKNYFITVFALNNHKEDTYYYEGFPNIFVVPALASRSGKDIDLYARNSFLKLINYKDSDVVFMLNDLEVINKISPYLKDIQNQRKLQKRKEFKTVFYFPIDSKVRKQDVEILSVVDIPVTYTQYAKNHLSELVNDKKIINKIKVIPHGVSSVFKRIHSADKKYTFGTVNRNSTRKDLGTLLLAFKRYKNLSEKHINDTLYVHSNPTDPFGINLYRVCQRLGLEIDKDVFFPENFNENQGFSEENLNKIYNSFDVFITTTTAEGWGLTVHEAMACETPVVAPMHTSLTELTGGAAIEIIRLQPAIFKNDFEKIRFISDIEDVVSKMSEAKEIIQNKVALRKKRKKLLIQAKKYSWEKSTDIFLKALK